MTAAQPIADKSRSYGLRPESKAFAGKLRSARFAVIKSPRASHQPVIDLTMPTA
jgi:hypothetical protein